MDPATGTTRSASGAGALQAFVRSSWLLLSVQLFVALLALGAIALAFFQIPPLLTQKEELQGQITQARQEAEAERIRVAGKREAYRFLQPALVALAHNNFDEALDAVRRANERSPNDAEILRAMAQAYYGKSRSRGVSIADRDAQLNAAIEALTTAHAVDAAVLQDVPAIATLKCAAGDSAGALEILQEPAFLAAARQDQSLITDDADLQNACSDQMVTVLALVGVADPDSTLFRIRSVYLHIRNQADRALAQEIGRGLSARGYAVAGIQLVDAPAPYDAGIRYYYNAQEEQAAGVRTLVTQIAAGTPSLARWREPLPTRSLQGSFDGLARDRIEIWLPGEAVRPQTNPSAVGSPQQIVRLLGAYSNANARGFTPVPDLADHIVQARRGEDNRWEVNLAPNMMYRIIGACDNACNNVDMELLNAQGAVVARDVLSDDYPIVTVTPSAAARYTVRLMLRACSSEQCFIGARIVQTAPRAANLEELPEILDGTVRGNAAGFPPTSQVPDEITALAQDAAHRWTLNLRAGQRYRIIGACDMSCSNLDFELTDAGGAMVDSDVLADDVPIVSVTPSTDGAYTLRIIMKTCSSPQCRAGARLLQR